MKRNLIKGIVIISTVVLSSCSSVNKSAGVKSVVNDDDVYYTRAKAGDKIDYIADAGQQNNTYNGDDDYYYYGDYASRINRFSSYSPFDYDDDFYFSYVPYNNGFGDGLNYDRDYYSTYYGFNPAINPAVDPAAPVDNSYIYSPYNYGYSPYDMGYDDFGYGDIYSAFILGGGGGGGGYGSAKLWPAVKATATATNTNPFARGVRTIPSPGVTRIGSSLPGKPSFSVNVATGIVTRTANLGANNAASRQAYTTQQQQSMAPRPSSSSVSTSSMSTGGSAGSSASGGGGARPASP